MSTRRDSFGGYQLVGLALLGLLAMSAAVIGNVGSGEAGLRMLVRATARSSLLLFGAAYAASSLRRLWKTPLTGWLLRQRRYLGLSFAASHALHLAAILGLDLVLGDAFTVDVPTLIGGGGAYVMIGLMAATSSDRAFARLGARRWRLLHRIGMHWIWIVFAVSYVPRAAMESPFYALPAGFVLALLGVRIAAFLRARRSRSVSAAA